MFFYLVLGGLVTYRLSLLISKEDGPAYIFRRVRKLPPPSTSAREGLSCEWCVSIWAGALVATYYWWIELIPGVEWPLYWLAMSALGIICNQQWTKESKNTAQPNAAGTAEKQQRPALIEKPESKLHE
jgi:hypothetical protein